MVLSVIDEEPESRVEWRPIGSQQILVLGISRRYTELFELIIIIRREPCWSLRFVLLQVQGMTAVTGELFEVEILAPNVVVHIVLKANFIVEVLRRIIL